MTLYFLVKRLCTQAPNLNWKEKKGKDGPAGGLRVSPRCYTITEFVGVCTFSGKIVYSFHQVLKRVLWLHNPTSTPKM